MVAAGQWNSAWKRRVRQPCQLASATAVVDIVQAVKDLLERYQAEIENRYSDADDLAYPTSPSYIGVFEILVRGTCDAARSRQSLLDFINAAIYAAQIDAREE